MTAIMESIKAIRNMRAEVNAAPGKKVPAILLVNAELREIVEANKNYINLMGSIDELIIDDIGAGKLKMLWPLLLPESRYICLWQD